MTKLGRLITICCLFLWVLVLAPGSGAQNQRPPILEQIAKTYGIDSWGKIEAIRYTWNGEITGLFKAAHSWEWEPKTGKISYEGKDKEGKPVKVSYVQSQINSAPANVKDEVAPAFVNDNYWLLFPFHAYWDTSATVTDQGMHKLPIGSGSADLVVVKYPTKAAVTRLATPGTSTSAKTTASSSLSTTAAGPRSRALSPQRGQATKRQVLC